jgi:hypothetical protein
MVSGPFGFQAVSMPRSRITEPSVPVADASRCLRGARV